MRSIKSVAIHPFLHPLHCLALVISTLLFVWPQLGFAQSQSAHAQTTTKTKTSSLLRPPLSMRYFSHFESRLVHPYYNRLSNLRRLFPTAVHPMTNPSMIDLETESGTISIAQNLEGNYLNDPYTWHLNGLYSGEPGGVYARIGDLPWLNAQVDGSEGTFSIAIPEDQLLTLLSGATLTFRLHDAGSQEIDVSLQVSPRLVSSPNGLLTSFPFPRVDGAQQPQTNSSDSTTLVTYLESSNQTDLEPARVTDVYTDGGQEFDFETTPSSNRSLTVSASPTTWVLASISEQLFVARDEGDPLFNFQVYLSPYNCQARSVSHSPNLLA